MKKIIILSLIISFTGASFSQSGWHWQNPYPQGNDLRSIVMNGSVGWAVGDMGTVIRTANEGNDWELVDIGTTETLNCIYMAGVAGKGWIVGTNGTVYYTSNAGETWVKQNSGTDAILYSVSAVEGNCPWICGNDIILKSYDEGETWIKITTIYHSRYRSIDHVDCENIWIAGEDGLVISTTDAGTTWKSHNTPTSRDLLSIDVSGVGDFRACGYAGTIISSSDRGNTWKKEHENLNYDLYNIDTKGILGPAYAVGSYGTILETLDGGQTWSKKESGTGNSLYGHTLYDVAFQALFHQVYIAGRYGMVLRKKDETGAGFETMNKLTHSWMQSVKFINSDKGWAVGGDVIDLSGNSEGVILHTTDGGKNWEAQLNIPYALSSVDFINEDEGWAVGRKGIIKHTINGGQNWGTQTSPLKGLLTAVCFVDKNNGWIVSRDNWGEIAHTTNGGSTWVAQTNPAKNPLHGVFFINQNKGWAVGLDSTIILTTDGGQNWKRATIKSDKNYRFASVYFIDELKGWAVGISGIIMLSNDGGLTWQQIKSGFNSTFNSVYFTDHNNGWIVGESGCILRSLNGGYTWFQLYSGVAGNFLSSVFFENNQKGWISGEGGTLLNTENGGFGNGPGTFQRNGLNLPVNDFTECIDTLLIDIAGKSTDNYYLVGMEVMIDSLLHSRVSDLELYLEHNGVTETLVYHTTDQGSDLLWTKLTDKASKGITDGLSPFSGNYKPYKPLSTFNDINLNGAWILKIYDNKAGATGTLKAWGIKPLFMKITSVNVPEAITAEYKIHLQQNKPNPFKGITNIGWISDINGNTSLKVYNINGQEIATLVNKFLIKGEHSVQFDSSHLSAGVYYYQLKIGSYTFSKRCIVM